MEAKKNNGWTKAQRLALVAAIEREEPGWEARSVIVGGKARVEVSAGPFAYHIVQANSRTFQLDPVDQDWLKPAKTWMVLSATWACGHINDMMRSQVMPPKLDAARIAGFVTDDIVPAFKEALQKHLSKEHIDPKAWDHAVERVRTAVQEATEELLS